MLMGDFQYSETPIRTLIDLGQAIRLKRKATGLRVNDAAALCGVSVDLLSRLENGKSGVATDRVLKDGRVRMSIAGCQDKLAVYLDPDNRMYLVEGELASTHILKPEPEDKRLPLLV